jgi:hypothetical protein
VECEHGQGKQLHVLEGHTADVSSVAFSPDSALGSNSSSSGSGGALGGTSGGAASASASASSPGDAEVGKADGIPTYKMLNPALENNLVVAGTADGWLVDAARCAYEHFLCKAYTDTGVDNDAAMGGVFRPNHGLAHSLRVSFLVPTVAAVMAEHEPAYKFDAGTIQMLQTCAVFSVVGRRSEVSWSADSPEPYDSYRRTSSSALKAVAADLRVKLDDGFDYAELVRSYLDPTAELFVSPRYTVLRLCHNLDLQRCYEFTQLPERLTELARLSKRALPAMLSLSRTMLLATGNRVLTPDGSCVDYNVSLFVKCSSSVTDCFAALKAVKTFASTHFHELHATSAAAALERDPFPHEVMGSVHGLLEHYAESRALDDSKALLCFEKVQTKAYTHSKGALTGKENLGVVCGRMWTTTDGSELLGRELCSIVNEILRVDSPDAVKRALPFIGGINMMCVTRRSEDGEKIEWPNDCVLYRGGDFDDRLRHCYLPGTVFRCPMFLATSKEKARAVEFMRRSESACKILWHVRVHVEHKCVHVNYFEGMTEVKGEHEFLFAPYSVFTVRSVQWQRPADNSWTNPHIVELDAAPDNQLESKHLPLSPWN